MNLNEVREGLKVKVTALGSTKGMLIADKHLGCRAAGVVGEITQMVPGHGGDVWFVKHDGSKDVGAYCYDEFERKGG